MAIPAAVSDAYSSIETDLIALARYVGSTLASWCNERDYAYRSRLKSPASLSEKLESGRFAAWSEIDDMFAATIVIPTTMHENEVLDFLGSTFDTDVVRRRNSTVKAPDVFRYDSTRFIGRVRSDGSTPLSAAAGLIRFEVQVPTAFEYAWSVVTHDITYKSDDVDWRRLRITAQLKAAVEQLELVTAGFEQNVDFVGKSFYPESDAKQKIIATFRQLASDGFVTAEILPASWSRFADNVYNVVWSYSKPNNVRDHVKQLCRSTDRFVRENDPLADLRSGSLFQAVVGFLSSGVVPSATLDDFYIVQSSELRDIHRVSHVPKPFQFDQ